MSEDKAYMRIGSHSGGRLYIPNEVQKEARLENGDTCHILVEIKCDEGFRNFRPHEVQYARVPPIAGNREHEKLDSMGVTFEWCKEENDETKWRGAALQRRHAHATIGNTNELTNVASSLNLFAILTQTVYSGPTPEWLLPYDHYAVKILKYNHGEQTYTLGSLRPNEVVWPPDNTVDEYREIAAGNPGQASIHYV
ncbi:hypothetical protein diail_4220 [Diaporthe ilicicola]|nr:hypothetical protein diail_4220 [Diaporthe ilicicola]